MPFARFNYMGSGCRASFRYWNPRNKSFAFIEYEAHPPAVSMTTTDRTLQHRFVRGVFLALSLFLIPCSGMAQPQISIAQEWMRAAPPVPDLKLPATRTAWEKQRTEIRGTLTRLLGDLPPRPVDPRAQTLSREDRGDYIFEKFEFDNGAGTRVPGYLFLPKRTGKVPAILWCHWHGGDYDNGKEELLRAEHTPEMPGPTLAKLGFAVLGIDACGFGERNGKGPGGSGEKGGAGEMTASKFNLWMGRSLWGMILRDDLMALDYLCSRPEVDSSRVGATGISRGATRTWWLMALDERLRAGVAVACLTRYQDLIEAGGLKHHGIYYFVPGMLREFDTEAVISLVAPRRLLCLTGDEDSGSPLAGIRKIEEQVRPAYELYEAASAFESVIYPKTGHVYTPDMWQRMVRWMGESLDRK